MKNDTFFKRQLCFSKHKSDFEFSLALPKKTGTIASDKKGMSIIMNLFVCNLRQLILGALAVCVAAGLVVTGCLAAKSAARETVSETRLIPVYNVEKEEKVMALSFDAAWGNEDTQTLIDILGKYNVKVTFFVVGEWVDKYPESVKALADAGHEIMNHSNTHPDMIKLSAADMAAEINACNDKIEVITGKRPTLFRAPYGSYNIQLIETLAKEKMTCIQWNIDSLDWKDPSVDQLCKNVVKKASPGSICLFHNAAKNTPEALPQILDALIADGYSFVPVSQLILKENFYIDHAGCQREKSNLGHIDVMEEETDVIAPNNTQPYYGDYYMDAWQTEKENDAE